MRKIIEVIREWHSEAKDICEDQDAIIKIRELAHIEHLTLEKVIALMENEIKINEELFKIKFVESMNRRKEKKAELQKSYDLLCLDEM